MTISALAAHLAQDIDTQTAAGGQQTPRGASERGGSSHLMATYDDAGTGSPVSSASRLAEITPETHDGGLLSMDKLGIRLPFTNPRGRGYCTARSLYGYRCSRLGAHDGRHAAIRPLDRTLLYVWVNDFRDRAVSLRIGWSR